MALPGRALAIVNPIAGNGKAARHWPALEAQLRNRYPELTVCPTTGRGDAERLAREWAEIASGPPAPRNDIVFAVGGDGTVHEVVNGLLHRAATAWIGILPMGTGNDFAATTGVPNPLAASLSRLGEAPRRFDVGRVRFLDPAGTEHTRHFLNSASVGVVPHANRLAGRIKRMIPGRLPYTLGGIGALMSAVTGHYRVTSMDRTVHSGPALNITVANGARFGAGMRISPDSRVDDGVLDQVVIGNLGKVRALVALSRLYAGTHVRMAGVAVTPASGPIRILRQDGNLLVEADGEEFQAGPEIVVDILPGAIQLVN